MGKADFETRIMGLSSYFSVMVVFSFVGLCSIYYIKCPEIVMTLNNTLNIERFSHINSQVNDFLLINNNNKFQCYCDFYRS